MSLPTNDASAPTSGTPVFFRSPVWLRRFLGITCLATALGAWVLHATDAVFAYSLGFDIAALFALAGFVDAVTTRVELKDEGVAVVVRLRRQLIPRAQIDHVTWEAGGGVSVQLTSGAWVRLPDVGNSQARTNSIRAWVKRRSG